MQCPSCGYSIADSQATTCPNCGRSLAAPYAPYAPYGAPPTYPPAQDPGATTGIPAAPAEGQPVYPAYPEYPAYPSGYPAPTSQGLPPGYGQPGMPSQGYPPVYGQPGAPSQGYPPAYGQPGVPSQTFPPGYGQPGVPSQGMPGYPYGYPPGYGQPGAPSQGFYGQAIPGMPGMPATPAKKRNPAGIIISVILAVVVVAGLLTAGLLTLSHSQGSTTNSTISRKSQVFNDPLTSNTNGWASDSHCFFGTDGYHVKDGYDCYVPSDVPNDFTLQVTVQQINGPTNYGYGISFRRVSRGNQYIFVIDGNGHWRIDKCANESCSPLADWTSSGGAIQAGLNQVNTIEVDGNGSHFDFFANGKKIGQIDDSTYSSGGAGLDGGQNIEVVYTNITVNQILH